MAAPTNASRDFALNTPDIAFHDAIAASHRQYMGEEVEDARGVVAIVRALQAEGIATVPQLEQLAAKAETIDGTAIIGTAFLEALLLSGVTAIGHAISNIWAKPVTVLVLSALVSGTMEASSQDALKGYILPPLPSYKRPWQGSGEGLKVDGLAVTLTLFLFFVLYLATVPGWVAWFDVVPPFLGGAKQAYRAWKWRRAMRDHHQQRWLQGSEEEVRARTRTLLRPSTLALILRSIGSRFLGSLVGCLAHATFCATLCCLFANAALSIKAARTEEADLKVIWTILATLALNGLDGTLVGAVNRPVWEWSLTKIAQRIKKLALLAWCRLSQGALGQVLDGILLESVRRVQRDWNERVRDERERYERAMAEGAIRGDLLQ